MGTKKVLPNRCKGKDRGDAFADGSRLENVRWTSLGADVQRYLKPMVMELLGASCSEEDMRRLVLKMIKHEQADKTSDRVDEYIELELDGNKVAVSTLQLKSTKNSTSITSVAGRTWVEFLLSRGHVDTAESLSEMVKAGKRSVVVDMSKWHGFVMDRKAVEELFRMAMMGWWKDRAEYLMFYMGKDLGRIHPLNASGVKIYKMQELIDALMYRWDKAVKKGCLTSGENSWLRSAGNGKVSLGGITLGRHSTEKEHCQVKGSPNVLSGYCDMHKMESLF